MHSCQYIEENICFSNDGINLPFSQNCPGSSRGQPSIISSGTPWDCKSTKKTLYLTTCVGSPKWQMDYLADSHASSRARLTNKTASCFYYYQCRDYTTSKIHFGSFCNGKFISTSPPYLLVHVCQDCWRISIITSNWCTC